MAWRFDDAGIVLPYVFSRGMFSCRLAHRRRGWSAHDVAPDAAPVRDWQIGLVSGLDFRSDKVRRWHGGFNDACIVRLSLPSEHYKVPPRASQARAVCA